MRTYIRRCGSVNEVEIRVVNALFDELLAVVLHFIQPDDMRHSEVLKDLDIIFGGIASALHVLVNRTHESDELAGNNPVQIPILYLLIVLVFLRVEVLKLIPPMSDCYLESFQTMKYLTYQLLVKSFKSF